MESMNNDFYTFKNGKVWKHHTNSVRNQYYGEDFDTIIQTVLNTESDQPKMFKTLALNGKNDKAWSAVVTSDLQSGNISEGGYEKKEGNWYGYIRRDSNDVDLKALSNKALGIVQSASTIGSVIQITVPNDVTSKIDIKSDSIDNGDLLFAAELSGTTIQSVGSVLGQVQSITYSSGLNLTIIDMVAAPGVTFDTPPIGYLLMSTKNTTAESYGVRGAYMDVTLTSSEKDEVELYVVASEVFKSYQ
jgi:hypothetical protein